MNLWLWQKSVPGQMATSYWLEWRENNLVDGWNELCAQCVKPMKNYGYLMLTYSGNLRKSSALVPFFIFVEPQVLSGAQIAVITDDRKDVVKYQFKSHKLHLAWSNKPLFARPSILKETWQGSLSEHHLGFYIYFLAFFFFKSCCKKVHEIPC